MKKEQHQARPAANRRKVILDTDIANEVDDIFALCYLLGSPEDMELEAITIAPFSNSPYTKTSSLAEGIELSYRLAEKVLELTGKTEYSGYTDYGDFNCTGGRNACDSRGRRW